MEFIKAGRGRRVNHRIHKGILGRAPHRRVDRQTAAQIRKAAYDELTPHEKLARLVGPAKKQRKRLLEQIREQ